MVWDREWVASEEGRTIDLSDFQMKDGWLQFKATRREPRRLEFGSVELDNVFFARIKFDGDDSYAGEWWDSKLRGDLFGSRAPP